MQFWFPTAFDMALVRCAGDLGGDAASFGAGDTIVDPYCDYRDEVVLRRIQL